MDSGPIRRLSLEERRNQTMSREPQIVTSPISPSQRFMEQERKGRVRRWSMEEFRPVQKYPATPVVQYSVQTRPVTYTQPAVQTVCQVQPLQVLQSPGRFRSGSFETVPGEPAVIQSQVQYSQQLQSPLEPNQWQDERSPIQYSQNYEPVYQVVHTQLQPYQTVPTPHPTQSIQPGYTSVPVQTYQSQTVSGQVLQPVMEDHLHKPLQAVQPMQFHMQDMYSLQQAPGVQPVIRLIETQPPVSSQADQKIQSVIKSPGKQITASNGELDENNTHSEEPVRVRKVSFQDEAKEETSVDEPYVGLRRLRPNRQAKSMDTDESPEQKPSRGILQRKSRSMSESNVNTGKVRRNSVCPMTAYNLR